jgi:hypothetical protein
MMTQSASDPKTPRAALELRDAVDGIFEAHFRLLTALSEAAEEISAVERRSGRALTTTALKSLRPRYREALVSGEKCLSGLGFIAAAGALDDEPLWLDWFVRAAEPGMDAVQFELDPTNAEFYDYTNSPWYARSTAASAPTITGPYVDYLGTDRYALTLMTPVDDGADVVGLCGADVYVCDLEAALLPLLRDTDHEMVLTNVDGRVIVSNSAHHVPGTLVSPNAKAFEQRRAEKTSARCAAVPFVVFVNEE